MKKFGDMQVAEFFSYRQKSRLSREKKKKRRPVQMKILSLDAQKNIRLLLLLIKNLR